MRDLPTYLRIRQKLHCTPEGCWINPVVRGFAVNQDDQALTMIQGKTVAIRPWLRRFFGVARTRTVPCHTPACVMPLHYPARKSLVATG